MKKIIALVLILTCLSLFFMLPTASASGSAEVGSDDSRFTTLATSSYASVKKSIQELNDGKITKNEFANEYGSQLQSVDICISGLKNLNDIYGIQFNVEADNDNVLLAYIETNLQNSEKIGVSRWEAYMTHMDTTLKYARVLMYGTRAVTAAPNDVVNKITSNKYKVATLYYFADDDLTEDFTLTYKVEDIASKDKTGTVKSIPNNFKEKIECKMSYVEKIEDISLKTLGAQIRVSGNQGLRFGTRVLKDAYYEECSDISYGTLIAVTNTLGTEELTLDAECSYLDSQGKILEDTDSYICFSGEITDFPKNGDYDSVNFTARAYVKYKAPDSDEYTVVYAEPIVRNVSQIKSIVGMK